MPLDDTSFNWDNILLCKFWYINVIKIVQQVMAVGLNTVREICMRIPLVSLVYSFCTSLLEQFDCQYFVALDSIVSRFCPSLAGLSIYAF